ncbi:MAG TPA: NAD(P)/FAD-dependent oxidoreductase [Solirubrobacteraceae bacterium]|jgi:2-polyprenyl-6-methoxyphenol hydroxylase-like FAD-dependent oxidoreductase|nr:NAD(P)/FAD-dependent oxidoreductase [Solirubrobacteraceae bacterium]
MSQAKVNGNVTAGEDYDAVVVGASLAGCASAILLARDGARVALVEQRPDPTAYKRICSHYIQSSAVATLERLGLLEPMLRAGAVRSRVRLRTPWGWIDPPAKPLVPSGVNLRRERLDPLIRETAAQTPGVDVFLGHTVHELLRDGETFCGALARDSSGAELRLRSRLLVGADGRGSRVAKLAGVKAKTVPHGRVAYGGYFEGPPPAGSPDASFWLLDPDMAAAFPTDSGLTFYAVMPVKERVEEFREDPAAALVEMLSRVPDAPPIAASRLVQPPQGKLDMTNVAHTPTAPGLALVGDAALAIDPLWGVGCGWALQSAEWLADSVSEALVRSEPLDAGLKGYRRRHARGLRGHAAMIYDYAGGRKFNAPERLLFSASTYDDGLAAVMEAFGTRNIGPGRMMMTGMPRALRARARRSLSRRRESTPGSVPVATPAEGSSSRAFR